MFKTTTFLFCLALISISIVKPDIITRHDLSEEKFIEFAKTIPAVKAIILYNKTDVAGTLIHSQWVLSAGHVAETIKDGHQLIINGNSVGIEKVIIHPGWGENGRPDLALIKLEKDITGIEPVPLYRQKNETGKKVIVAGIGDYGTGLTGPTTRNGKMRAGTNLIDGFTSDGVLLHWEFDAPDVEKATALEAISGPGDSSGPAFIESNGIYYIAGISAAQSTRATGGKEGVYGVTEYYTRVSSFIDWIEGHTGKL